MLTRISHIENSRRLILIFAGWSTTPDLYLDVRHPGWDVAVVHDYGSFRFSEEEVSFLNRYDTIWIYAWSLGVAAAEAIFANHPGIRVTAAYAINGSTAPADDSEGIPVAVFEGTMTNLSLTNLLKFRKRMAGDTATFKVLFDTEFDNEEICRLKQQLNLFLSHSFPEQTSLPWRRAYIGENDRIFPPANLERNWLKNGVEIIRTPQPHYISIASIVRQTLPDTEEIGRKFESALSTYDHHAQAQSHIAGRLADMILKGGRPSAMRILEIGQGSGILTRKYATALNPEEIDFVDISGTPVFGIAPKENYHKSDAEEWVAKNTDKRYDLIVSASTVQWFSDLDTFLRNCSKLLKEDGVICLSTFLPGNLYELDHLRPAPIHYHSKEEILDMAARYFNIVETDEETITLNFDSAKQLLLHLRYTGVAGSVGCPKSSAHNLSNHLSSIPTTLSYRPLYLKLTPKAEHSE